jgi:hypothetical protein
MPTTTASHAFLGPSPQSLAPRLYSLFTAFVFQITSAQDSPHLGVYSHESNQHGRFFICTHTPYGKKHAEGAETSAKTIAEWWGRIGEGKLVE